ncbi:MAG: 4Fe-4S dicluster domain-containing protein [Limnochordia bacterium]|jgi:2-oxoglutarate ferredoxin oxidoreductase subunit delta|nr:4Fe-4S dicluster domain-containing protein [Limnochordia bacterium]MDD4517944.1 4Fe-4S dicluster domain-containing protein [Limnochordia bacterium]
MAKITIDRERCKGCSLCVAFCPQKILELEKATNAKGFHPASIKDEQKCTGCAQCATMCPDICIEVYR